MLRKTIDDFYVRYVFELEDIEQFYIEIYNNQEDVPSYYLMCSLAYNIHSNPDLEYLIDRASTIDITDEERSEAVGNLFFAIKNIEGIEQYFANSLTMQLILDELGDLTIDEFIPFSPDHNRQTYYSLCALFGQFHHSFEYYEITREEFESIIKDRIELELGYVDAYNENLKFYCVKNDREDLHLEIYLTLLNGDTSFFFFKRVSFS